jgi:hypothetical protein
MQEICIGGISFEKAVDEAQLPTITDFNPSATIRYQKEQKSSLA